MSTKLIEAHVNVINCKLNERELKESQNPIISKDTSFIKWFKNRGWSALSRSEMIITTDRYQIIGILDDIPEGGFFDVYKLTDDEEPITEDVSIDRLKKYLPTLTADDIASFKWINIHENDE